MIPYGRQSISQEDIESVCETLRSDFLTQGPKVPLLESAICGVTQANHAVCVNSATSALHLACLALQVSMDDEVWVSPITFVASSNCILYCKAKPVFIDVDPKTNNICIRAIEDKLKAYKAQDRAMPKVIIAVHLSGLPCEMESLFKLSKEYGFSIIEDASHAIGAYYKSKPVGCCEFSNITIFSFHPVKIITTGEGGVAVTNDAELAEKMQSLRSHGITRDRDQLKQNHGPWYYEQQALGYNYRLTDIQAALGISQLSRLKSFIKSRIEVSKFYFKSLKNLPIELPHVSSDSVSSWHLFIIKLKLNSLSKSHKKIFEELREEGIGVNLHYIPIYKQPYYQENGFKQELCEVAESYYSRAISIPIYHGITQTDQQAVVNALTKVLL